MISRHWNKVSMKKKGKKKTKERRRRAAIYRPRGARAPAAAWGCDSRHRRLRWFSVAPSGAYQGTELQPPCVPGATRHAWFDKVVALWAMHRRKPLYSNLVRLDAFRLAARLYTVPSSFGDCFFFFRRESPAAPPKRPYNVEPASQPVTGVGLSCPMRVESGSHDAPAQQPAVTASASTHHPSQGSANTLNIVHQRLIEAAISNTLRLCPPPSFTHPYRPRRHLPPKQPTRNEPPR